MVDADNLTKFNAIRIIIAEEILVMGMGETFRPDLKTQRSWRKCILS